MAKNIQLTEVAESAHKTYAPVEIGDGITISATRDIKDDKFQVEGNVEKEGKNIGRYVFSEEQGRMFVNIQIDGISRNTSRDIADTINSMILQLVPEAEAEAEATGE